MDKNDNEQNNRGKKKNFISFTVLPEIEMVVWGTPLVVQWLRLSLPKQGGVGLTPGGELRSHMPYCQKIKT